jgi:hypothetical protein
MAHYTLAICPCWQMLVFLLFISGVAGVGGWLTGNWQHTFGGYLPLLLFLLLSFSLLKMAGTFEQQLINMLVAVWLLMVVGVFWAKIEEDVDVGREEWVLLGEHRRALEATKGEMRGLEKRDSLSIRAPV